MKHENYNRSESSGSSSRGEKKKSGEKLPREFSQKLGGLANRLMINAKGLLADAGDALSNYSLKVNLLKNREKLFKNCGIYDREKYSLQGRQGERKIEDSSFVDEENAAFGVFDGAGGVGEPGSGRIASRTARDSFREQIRNKKVHSPDDLAMLLNDASIEVGKKTEGITTATVAKIVTEGRKKFLYYAQVGDSRLYIVHQGNKNQKSWAEQITRDEGVQNMISNWLGRENFAPEVDSEGNKSYFARTRVKQRGKVPLRDGDKIVLCSDGVTGDFNRQMADGRNELMGLSELAHIVDGANHVQVAAMSLVERARKNDDRSAIVVEV